MKMRQAQFELAAFLFHMLLPVETPVSMVLTGEFAKCAHKLITSLLSCSLIKLMHKIVHSVEIGQIKDYHIPETKQN